MVAPGPPPRCAYQFHQQWYVLAMAVPLHAQGQVLSRLSPIGKVCSRWGYTPMTLACAHHSWSVAFTPIAALAMARRGCQCLPSGLCGAALRGFPSLRRGRRYCPPWPLGPACACLASTPTAFWRSQRRCRPSSLDDATVFRVEADHLRARHGQAVGHGIDGKDAPAFISLADGELPTNTPPCAGLTGQVRAEIPGGKNIDNIKACLPAPSGTFSGSRWRTARAPPGLQAVEGPVDAARHRTFAPASRPFRAGHVARSTPRGSIGEQ